MIVPHPLAPSLRTWPRRLRWTGVSWANTDIPAADPTPGRALQDDGHDQAPTPVRRDEAWEACERLFNLHSRW